MDCSRASTVAGVEPAAQGPAMGRKAGPPRLELGIPGPKPGVLPITPRASDAVEMTGHHEPRTVPANGCLSVERGASTAAARNPAWPNPVPRHIPGAEASASRDWTPHAAPPLTVSPTAPVRGTAHSNGSGGRVKHEPKTRHKTTQRRHVPPPHSRHSGHPTHAAQ
jgi:hypothetical protein